MSSTPDANQERLQLYLDGELDVAARLEFEAALATDTGLAAELERARRMRGLFERVPEALTVDLPSELGFERLLRNIHAELDAPSAARAEPGSAPLAPARVVPIDAARRRNRSLIGGVVALAAAAAVAVVTLVPNRESGNGGREPAHVAVTSTARPRTPGTEIIGVEFGKSSGTYWEQSDGDDRVAIVWIDDTMPSEVARP